MTLLRRLLLFKLGALLGVMVAAALAKRFVPSRGDEESDELGLVAIYDGVELRSRARAFTGGSALAWFGGIELDLSDAELAEGARLSAHAIFGGIDITTPPGWRIESRAKALMGGIDSSSGPQDDPDAPVLTLDGMAVFGGIDIGPAAAQPTS
jgi:hypothetical protein